MAQVRVTRKMMSSDIDSSSPGTGRNDGDDGDTTKDVIHDHDGDADSHVRSDCVRSNGNAGSRALAQDELARKGSRTKCGDASAATVDDSPSTTSSILRKRHVVGGVARPPTAGDNHVRDSSSAAAGDINTNNSNLSNHAARPGDGSSSQNENVNHRQRRQSTSDDEEMKATDTTQETQDNGQQEQNNQRTAQELILMQKFWRTYDTIIILSIFAVFGIMFRMMSATWFRLELGAVFSEDSALGTNLPLNIWSCFLMGLLCSGSEAMGIVHSKVLGGANPYGSGRGILEVGKGAYRGVVDAGRAGINRARGYSSNINSSTALENTGEESPGYRESSPTNRSIRVVPTSTDAQSGGEIGQLSPRHKINDHNSNRSTGSEEIGQMSPRHTINDHNSNWSTGSEESIAGLLGLDDDFRIVGSHQNSEDEIREVQLRGLTMRIMRSPCLVIFPARKESNDVMEHYESDQLPPLRRPPSIPEDQFAIGDLDDDSNGDVEFVDIEMSEQLTSSSGEASGETSGIDSGQLEGARAPFRFAEPPTEPRRLTTSESNIHPPSNISRSRSESSTSAIEKVDEIIHSVSDQVTTFRRVHLLDGWNVDTSPEKMKHIILLGLRVGFCGALSTFSSLNASVISLLKKGAVGEALVGYALSIQMGIVSYRFGQHCAVYIFVWRCRRETMRDEKRGYGLRLRSLDSEEDVMAEESARRRWVIPSVRTVATLSFLSMFVSLCLAIRFSTVQTREQYWCSLLFTPFGCLARYALMSKYNKRLPGFPLGTFSCNLLSCALSGSLGSFLAGNPGPEESVLLISMIAGFAGSLSTFATFIVEILSLMDPIIFKFDGLVYALITVWWAVIIGALGSQAKNWADET